MANIDKVSVKNTVYNIVSPAVVSDYIEVIGGACTKPDGYEEDEVILAKQNDVQLLFKATQDIAFGANIVENTNCVRTTLEEVLKNAGGGGGASSADQVSYDNSASGLEAENVQEAVDELASKAGTASSQIQTLTNEVTDISDEIADMNNVLGAKNLFPNEAVSATSSGITFTVNSDGTVSVSGTATANAYITFPIISLKKGTYILSGCPDINQSETKAFLYIGSLSVFDYGSGAKFTLSSDNDNINLAIRVNAGVSFSSAITFKPMIRLASIADDTYEPYSMTNQELTPIAQAVSNRNLLDNPWFTVNQRGQASYTGNVYGPDRWLFHSGQTVTVSNNGISVDTDDDFWQRFGTNSDFFTSLIGKTVTISVLTSTGVIYSGSAIVNATGITNCIIGDKIIAFVGRDQYFDYIGIRAMDTSLTIRAIKLELGSVSTLAQDTEPNYATELLKCQRYFVAIPISESIARINQTITAIRVQGIYTNNLRSPVSSVTTSATGVNVSGNGTQVNLAYESDFTLAFESGQGVKLNLTTAGAAKLPDMGNQLVGLWDYQNKIYVSAEL